MESTNPQIKEYRHHYSSIFYSRDELSLVAAGQSIKKTVPVGHHELALLEAAYREGRAELREAARREAVRKAKEEVEKVVVEK